MFSITHWLILLLPILVIIVVLILVLGRQKPRD
jgi:hypothetical protein